MSERLTHVFQGGITAFALVLFALAVSTSPAAAQMGPVTSIQLAPLNPVLTSDETVTFTVNALDDTGNVEDVTDQAVFSENDPFGSFSANVYFAGKVGTWDIQATYRGLTAQTKVTVTEGILSELVVNPNTAPETLNVGETRTFTAEGFDADNNLITNISPTWTVQGNQGTIDANGVFTATQAGNGTVVATLGDISAAVVVQVNGTAEEKVEETPEATVTSGTNTNTAPAGGEVLGEEVTTNSEEATEEGPADTAATAEPTEEEAAAETLCTTYDWWVWLLGIIIYLLSLGAYYSVVKRRNDLIIWLAPVLLTAAALWAFFALTCPNAFLWVPWVAVIGGLLVTLFRPREFQPENGSDL